MHLHQGGFGRASRHKVSHQQEPGVPGHPVGAGRGEGRDHLPDRRRTGHLLLRGGRRVVLPARRHRGSGAPGARAAAHGGLSQRRRQGLEILPDGAVHRVPRHLLGVPEDPLHLRSLRSQPKSAAMTRGCPSGDRARPCPPPCPRWCAAARARTHRDQAAASGPPPQVGGLRASRPAPRPLVNSSSGVAAGGPGRGEGRWERWSALHRLRVAAMAPPAVASRATGGPLRRARWRCT
mmetsp:Transcript_118237/g.314644  ORF Transcript_118237/g.314644 Transcript_118237/m.314644 type:complete len:236 (-) Transcript_118237:166-873(-)